MKIEELKHARDILTNVLKCHKTVGCNVACITCPNDYDGDDEWDDGYPDDDDDDAFDEDKLTEESYRTTFDTDPEDLGLEAEEISDDYED